MRERWFGATGRRVPEIAVEGDPAVPVDEALVLDDASDVEGLRAAHERGTPVIVRASTAKQVKEALSHPEVSCVLVPRERTELTDLDLVQLTYE